MKKIILLITTALVLFNFSTTFAQDEDINEALETLQEKLILNEKKLDDARTDLGAIMGIHQSEEDCDTIVDIDLAVSEANQIYKYLIPIALLSRYVSEDNLKWCYRIIYDALLESKQDLDRCYNRAQIYYSEIEEKSLFDTADKIEEVLRDTISEIDPAIQLLSKATGSAQ